MLYTMKNDIDETYKKSMVGKKYSERYWEALQNNFKLADEKYKKLIASFELTVTTEKSEADF